MQEMEIYSQVKPGTFLQIREGQLYNAKQKHVVRSISSKDHVDLVSRSFQLSNNTGRFCRITCPPPESSWGDACYSNPPPPLYDQDGEPNPVEVCSDDCFSSNAITKTCYSPKS